MKKLGPCESTESLEIKQMQNIEQNLQLDENGQPVKNLSNLNLLSPMI